VHLRCNDAFGTLYVKLAAAFCVSLSQLFKLLQVLWPFVFLPPFKIKVPVLFVSRYTLFIKLCVRKANDGR